MPFSLIGYYESASNSALALITAIADQHVTVSGDDITVPELDQVLGAFFMSPSIEEAQLSSPSLRRFILHDFHPLWTLDYLSQLYPQYHDFKENPLQLERGEKLNVLINNGGNSEGNYGLVWICDGTPVPAKGQIRTIRATLTGSDSSMVWKNAAITLSQTLPVGRYAVVGMLARPGNEQQLIAARLVFVGGSWRPGIMGGMARIDLRPQIFRNGNLGIWGEFESDQPPTIDYLSKGDTGTIYLYLDLIQLRSGK